MSIILLDYIAIFGVFADAFTYGFMPIYASSFFVIVALLIWPSAWEKITINRTFFVMFFIIFCLSLINLYLGNDLFDRLFKQIAGIGISALAFYIFIKANKYDAHKLFRIYLKIAVVIGIIGLIQFLSSLVGFRPGYDFGWILIKWGSTRMSGSFIRVNSILPEPAGFCFVMMPACFTALNSLISRSYKLLNRCQCLIILASFILSFSAIGLLGMGFAICLILYNNQKIRYLFWELMIVVVVAFLSYNYVGNIRIRVDDSYKIITGGTAYLGVVNESTYALFSNFFVSINNFKENPFFGSGLGSYGLVYQRQIDRVSAIGQSQFDKLMINAEDANSMFLRLLSETGLFGVLLVFTFMAKFYLRKKKDRTGYLWIVNNGILCLFFVRLIRGGHYFDNGFFFFVWMYYFSKVNARQTNELLNEDG